MSSSRRPSARDRRLAEELDGLIDICNSRGLSSRHLRQVIHDTCVQNIHVDSPIYEHEWRRADKLSSAGLAAQLSFLRDAWGARKIKGTLGQMGGILDAIVRRTSSTPAEIEEDIGRQHVDSTGELL